MASSRAQLSAQVRQKGVWGPKTKEGLVHAPNKPSHTVNGRESRALETRERNIFQLMATFFSHLFTKKAFSGKS